VGLDSKACKPLNGKFGVVVGFNADTGRWSVKLDGNNLAINCRPINSDCRPINMDPVAEIPYFDSAGKLVGHKASIEYTLLQMDQLDGHEEDSHWLAVSKRIRGAGESKEAPVRVNTRRGGARVYCK
jgi:hypothetical protein